MPFLVAIGGDHHIIRAMYPRMAFQHEELKSIDLILTTIFLTVYRAVFLQRRSRELLDNEELQVSCASQNSV